MVSPMPARSRSGSSGVSRTLVASGRMVAAWARTGVVTSSARLCPEPLEEPSSRLASCTPNSERSPA
jgi:hypothetical protein